MHYVFILLICLWTAPLLHCQVDGNWAEWGEWTTCPASCGIATKRRLRSCTNPSPQDGGDACNGNNVDKIFCDLPYCPGCETAVDDRIYLNNATDVDDCIQAGLCFEMSQATIPGCYRKKINGNWSPWEQWSPCSTTCGYATQIRIRYCTNPAPDYGGNNCYGDNTESKVCQFHPCKAFNVYKELTSQPASTSQLLAKSVSKFQCIMKCQNNNNCNTPGFIPSTHDARIGNCMITDDAYDLNNANQNIIVFNEIFQKLPSTTGILTTDLPTTDLPTTDLPTTDLSTSDLPTTDLLTTDLPTSDLPTTHLPTSDLPTSDLPTTDLLTIDLPTSDLPTTDLPTTDLSTSDPDN